MLRGSLFSARPHTDTLFVNRPCPATGLRTPS